MLHSAISFAQLPECDEMLEAGFPQWFGYVSYAMRHDVESRLNVLEKPPICLPDMLWVSYRHMLRFDHDKRIVEYFSAEDVGDAPAILSQDLNLTPKPFPKVTAISSSVTRLQYEHSVLKTVAEIQAGNFYQANITRKFYGECEHAIDPLQCFVDLCNISPSPYSALMIMGEQAIISSSPEGFISVDAQRQICSRPIKGSAARSSDSHEDTAIQKALESSTKNHSENLMIVDLMRNDLARICMENTVKVHELAKLYSYATIHHLISNVQGKLNQGATHADVLRATFPPGSMTGAPKIAAMQWCENQEPCERGAYSGAIGWLGAKSTCDFSVLIRCIIISGARFEFQVGAGIVADSDAQAEWMETLIKARAVCKVLGIDESELASL